MPPLAAQNKTDGSFFDNQKNSALPFKDQFPPISAVPFMVASMEASVEASLRIPRSQVLNVWYIYLHLGPPKLPSFVGK